jgi:hypothetical protein
MGRPRPWLLLRRQHAGEEMSGPPDGNYRYIVIDNEAGMEHFSRLTTRDVDLLFVLSDPSRRGIRRPRASGTSFASWIYTLLTRCW